MVDPGVVIGMLYPMVIIRQCLYFHIDDIINMVLLVSMESQYVLVPHNVTQMIVASFVMPACVYVCVRVCVCMCACVSGYICSVCLCANASQ